MSDGLRDQYRLVVDAIAAETQALGFKALRGGDEMARSSGELRQRLAVSLRVPRGAVVGYVEVFPGFNFSKLEALAADLQGKKPRAGFITCSLNLGLLMPKGSAVEWRLGADDNAGAVARLVMDAVRTFATPFWTEFASIPELLACYDASDARVCRGVEWRWRQVAANVLTSQTGRAVSLLDGMLASAHPSARLAVERALQRVSSPAAR